MILYGGDAKTVEKQMKCDHKWHGPCINHIARYYKCTLCYLIDYDCTIKEYYERLKEN